MPVRITDGSFERAVVESSVYSNVGLQGLPSHCRLQQPQRCRNAGQLRIARESLGLQSLCGCKVSGLQAEPEPPPPNLKNAGPHVGVMMTAVCPERVLVKSSVLVFAALPDPTPRIPDSRPLTRGASTEKA